MENDTLDEGEHDYKRVQLKKKRKRLFIQAFLFLATVVTTTLTGYGLLVNTENQDIWIGLWFSVPFLLILSAHEFGHYFTARFHKVKVTLPYYIPFLPGVLGTFGAFISIRERINDRKKFFDIGIAGPLAGFVVAFILLIIGFASLPSEEDIYRFHPEYRDYNNWQTEAYQPQNLESQTLLKTGSTLLFKIMESVIKPADAWMPNEYEMIHYPFLYAGFLALFFTALNLFPIGQTDGGHIVYGLFGNKVHLWVSRMFYVFLIFTGGMHLFSENSILGDFHPFASGENFLLFTALYLIFLYYLFSKFSGRLIINLGMVVLVFSGQVLLAQFTTAFSGFFGYLVFALVIGRFVGLNHPPSGVRKEKMGRTRFILGGIALLVFILSFSLTPLDVEVIGG